MARDLVLWWVCCFYCSLCLRFSCWLWVVDVGCFGVVWLVLETMFGWWFMVVGEFWFVVSWLGALLLYSYAGFIVVLYLEIACWLLVLGFLLDLPFCAFF